MIKKRNNPQKKRKQLCLLYCLYTHQTMTTFENNPSSNLQSFIQMIAFVSHFLPEKNNRHVDIGADSSLSRPRVFAAKNIDPYTTILEEKSTFVTPLNSSQDQVLNSFQNWSAKWFSKLPSGASEGGRKIVQRMFKEIWNCSIRHRKGFLKLKKKNEAFCLLLR